MTAISMTKVKNRLKDRGDFDFALRNVRINGDLRGCSGFVTDRSSGRIVYLNTEQSVYSPLQGRVLYRSAKNHKDFTGGRNHFGEVSGDEYITEIVDMLSDPATYHRAG